MYSKSGPYNILASGKTCSERDWSEGTQRKVRTCMSLSMLRDSHVNLCSVRVHCLCL